MRCSKTGDLPSCSAVCGRTLACGRHVCNELCHAGPCSSCAVSMELTCHCGQEKKTLLCGESKELEFSCQQICNRSLSLSLSLHLPPSSLSLILFSYCLFIPYMYLSTESWTVVIIYVSVRVILAHVSHAAFSLPVWLTVPVVLRLFPASLGKGLVGPRVWTPYQLAITSVARHFLAPLQVRVHVHLYQDECYSYLV